MTAKCNVNVVLCDDRRSDTFIILSVTFALIDILSVYVTVFVVKLSLYHCLKYFLLHYGASDPSLFFGLFLLCFGPVLSE